MEININKIAKQLMKLRENRMTGLLMAGHLREELGFEGYSEVLRRRWVLPEADQSGMVTLTNNLTVIEEIRKLAAEAKDCCDACKKDESECTCEKKPMGESLENAAHQIAVSHAFRRNLSEVATLGLGRTGDAPTTPVIGLGANSAAPAAPRPAAPSAAAPAQPSAGGATPGVGVGSDVQVVENGKQYVGKVSGVKPDGKYSVSFAGERPPAVRDYDKTEIAPLAAAK